MKREDGENIIIPLQPAYPYDTIQYDARQCEVKKDGKSSEKPKYPRKGSSHRN